MSEAFKTNIWPILQETLLKLSTSDDGKQQSLPTDIFKLQQGAEETVEDYCVRVSETFRTNFQKEDFHNKQEGDDSENDHERKLQVMNTIFLGGL